MTTRRAVRLLAAAVTATLLAAGAPAGTASAFALRDVVLVGNSAAGSVSILDGATFAPLATVNVIPDLQQRLDEMDLAERAGYELARSQKGGNFWADDVYLSPDGRTMYVSRGILADVVAIDLATGAQRWRFEVEGILSDHMALSPDGRRLVVSAISAGTVHVLDTATGAQVGSYDGGTYPHGNDYSANGQRIYTQSIGVTLLPRALEFLKGARQVTVVDANTLRIVRTYRFNHGVRPVAILPDESLMYAQLSYLNGFVEYDLRAGRITRTIELPFSPAGRAMSPDDYPQNSAHHGIALSGDNSKICSAGTIDDYVAILSRPALTVDRIVSTPSMPYWATTSRDGRKCLVSTSNTDQLVAIDFATAREVARVSVGDYPQRVRLGTIDTDVLAAID